MSAIIIFPSQTRSLTFKAVNKLHYKLIQLTRLNAPHDTVNRGSQELRQCDCQARALHHHV